jgi:hypothetical protein
MANPREGGLHGMMSQFDNSSHPQTHKSSYLLPAKQKGLVFVKQSTTLSHYF